jgi:hypothetical protein
MCTTSMQPATKLLGCARSNESRAPASRPPPPPLQRVCGVREGVQGDSDGPLLLERLQAAGEVSTKQELRRAAGKVSGTENPYLSRVVINGDCLTWAK